MKQTTICFLIKDGKVLLGMKKRGFGVGKWNGFGGKIKAGEDIKSSAIREIKEEIGVDVTPKDTRDAGVLDFRHKDNPDWDTSCNIFIIERWAGEPTESDEMCPEWYEMTKLPFGSMWADDPHWLPLVLAGKKIKGRFLFDDNGKEILNFAVSEVHP